MVSATRKKRSMFDNGVRHVPAKHIKSIIQYQSDKKKKNDENAHKIIYQWQERACVRVHEPCTLLIKIPLFFSVFLEIIF